MKSPKTPRPEEPQMSKLEEFHRNMSPIVAQLPVMLDNKATVDRLEFKCLRCRATFPDADARGVVQNVGFGFTIRAITWCGVCKKWGQHTSMIVEDGKGLKFEGPPAGTQVPLVFPELKDQVTLVTKDGFKFKNGSTRVGLPYPEQDLLTKTLAKRLPTEAEHKEFAEKQEAAYREEMAQAVHDMVLAPVGWFKHWPWLVASGTLILLGVAMFLRDVTR